MEMAFKNVVIEFLIKYSSKSFKHFLNIIRKLWEKKKYINKNINNMFFH